MKCREILPSDYTQFLTLINDFRSTSFTEEQFCETLTALYPHTHIYVLEENGSLLATATVIFERKFIFNLSLLAHIEDVCVKEEYRGSGLGKLLVQYCIEQTKAKGAYKVTLDCAESNVGFYEKCGFERRGTQMTILHFDPSKA